MDFSALSGNGDVSISAKYFQTFDNIQSINQQSLICINFLRVIFFHHILAYRVCLISVLYCYVTQMLLIKLQNIYVYNAAFIFWGAS